jgi:hypothetical protein
VGATPVPIPNTEVKPHFGDGTAGITCGRVARRWDSIRKRRRVDPWVDTAPLLFWGVPVILDGVPQGRSEAYLTGWLLSDVGKNLAQINYPPLSIWIRSFRLDRFVDFGKSDFVGREAALREREVGSAQGFVLLDVDAGDADASADDGIWIGERRVGFVTSGAYGHHVTKSLALAYLDRDVIEADPKLSIFVVGEEPSARILPEPPYDPKSSNLRDQGEGASSYIHPVPEGAHPCSNPARESNEQADLLLQGVRFENHSLRIRLQSRIADLTLRDAGLEFADQTAL